MAAHRGQLVVTVTSAEPLAAGGAEMKRLEKALKGSKIAQGKDLKLVNRGNPGILGGLEVDFGEQTIDLSASSKVNKFNAALARESWSSLRILVCVGLTVCLLMFFPSQRESKYQPIIIDLAPNEERTLDLAWENTIKPLSVYFGVRESGRKIEWNLDEKNDNAIKRIENRSEEESGWRSMCLGRRPRNG
jgi:hypothetical protein